MTTEKLTEKELYRAIEKCKIYLARWTLGTCVCAAILIASIAAIVCGLYFDTSLTSDQRTGLLLPGILLGLISLIAGICLLICRYVEQDELRDLNHELDDILEAKVDSWKN